MRIKIIPIINNGDWIISDRFSSSTMAYQGFGRKIDKVLIKKLEDIAKADIVLLGVSRTNKTPTSIYLANRGYKTINIPLVLDQKIPDDLKSSNNKICVVGLVADPERLADIRRNRVAIMQDNNIKDYTDLNFISVFPNLIISPS